MSVAPALASAPWTGQNPPSSAQCEEALRKSPWKSGHGFASPPPGTAFCMRTNVERLAHIRIVRTVDEGFLVDVLVWQ
nr:hypothetical protein GCM10020093_096890 [Planobispora longispora]